MSIANSFNHFAKWTARTAGHPSTFGIAVAIIVVWAITGRIFHFSDSWQLVINTGTTIVTFLMVFLIQRSQNKDAQALHLKLNEIVAALEGASNRLINIEELTEDEVRVLHQHYRTLVSIAKAETSLTHSHSIEEATARHRRKKRAARAPGTSAPMESAQPPAPSVDRLTGGPARPDVE